MEVPLDQIAVPTTTEGIAIHLGYISKNLSELNKKMDSVAANTVNREEWNSHLKSFGDHEARIRDLEGKDGEKTTAITTLNTTIKVWGSAILVIWALIDFALKYFYH